MRNYYFETERQSVNNYPYIDIYCENLFCTAHFHEEIEVIYVVRGKVDAICDENSYTARENEFFIFMPGEVHGFIEGCENAVYVFKMLPLSKTEKINFSALRLSGGNLITKKSPAYAELSSSILNIAKEEKERMPGYEFAVNQYVNEFAMHLFRSGNLKPIPKDEQTKLNTKLTLIQSAHGYIEQHYQEQIDLETAAKACGYSKYYFAHYFKEVLHLSFYSYLTLFRLEKAIALMRMGEKSMTEIAQDCGFGNVRSFNRMFKKYYYTTPSAYK